MQLLRCIQLANACFLLKLLTKPAKLNNCYDLWIFTKRQLEQSAYEIHSYYAMYAIYLNTTQYSPGRYVLKIHFFLESGLKMIQFKIQFKTKSKIFIQKNIHSIESNIQ